LFILALLILVLLFLRRQAIDGEGGFRPLRGSSLTLFTGNKQIISCRVNMLWRASRPPYSVRGHIGAKRKGPQLALEPLNGRGVAGYVPKP
jgi:hypothetical protein